MKFVMLKYIFEDERFTRVEFKTRSTNIRSQKALAKIGATKEGVLRDYFVEQGIRHDLVYYSILYNEWQRIKKTMFKSEF